MLHIYIYHRLEEITSLVTGVKSSIYNYRLEEITPTVPPVNFSMYKLETLYNGI